VTESRKSDGHPVDDMQLLRDIVLGEEKDRLHKLDQRVSDLELRTRDVAEVLPEAMNRLVADPASLPEIEKPVVTTIRGAIKRDTQSFADALFPVLGPAIRRAVADALKGMVQRINVALENSLTIKGLKWRLEAVRTGVPFAQIVLRHTMLYAVQEAFLIQRGSGLILASVHRDELLALDEDAVAAMLTAIQAFIQDSFGLSSDEPLRSAELGDRTLWVINGPAAVLACVITGTPPRAVRAELMSLLETLHARFGNHFGNQPDALAGHAGLQALMNEALREEVDESVSSTTRFKYKVLWIAVGLLLLLYLLFSSINTWREQQFARQVTALFGAQAGYVITSAEMDDGILNITGLRDPESVQSSALLDSRQISASKVTTDFSPYQSLDRDLVIKRLERRFKLNPPTALSLEGDELTVNGTLNSSQLASLQTLPQFHAMIRSVRLEGVRLDAEEASNVFRKTLNAPDSVHFVAAGTRLAVTGSAEGAWYTAAREVEIDVPGWQLDFRPLEESLSAQLDDIVQDLNGRVFQYIDSTRLTPVSHSSLSSTSTELVRAQGLASALGVSLNIILEGSSDGTGSREKNVEVAMNRSRHLLGELVARNVTDHDVVQTQAAWQEGDANPEQRRVALLIKRNVDP